MSGFPRKGSPAGVLGPEPLGVESTDVRGGEDAVLALTSALDLQQPRAEEEQWPEEERQVRDDKRDQWAGQRLQMHAREHHALGVDAGDHR